MSIDNPQRARRRHQKNKDPLSVYTMKNSATTGQSSLQEELVTSSESNSADAAFILHDPPSSLLRSKVTFKMRYIQAIKIFAIGVTVISFALLIYSCVFVNRPGPPTMYNHFPAIAMSACLVFQTLQILLLTRNWHIHTSRMMRTLRWAYWIVLSVVTFISGVCWAISRKPDTASIQFLAFFATLSIFPLLLWPSEMASLTSKFPWHLRLGFGFNRGLRVIHLVFSTLFAAGAITLSLQYRFENPGRIYSVKFTNGYVADINVYCTGPPNNTTPTIWFESTEAHGITDFLGVQTYLLSDHNRSSCSYDHIGFGWSSPAPKSFTNTSMHWKPMLQALGRENEPYVGVGWGGGAEDIISHALESPSTTKGAVLMDTSPDGIEWMDAAREHNWDDKRMLEFRKVDLAGRVSLTRIILSLAIPWGLMPVFIPFNNTAYFDHALYPRHRAQSLKDTMWSFQYYALISMSALPRPSDYLTSSVLPLSIPVYSLMTNNTVSASADFQLQLKIDLVAHLAGGKDKVQAWGWCVDHDCNLGFPVDKARWTAKALVELGI